MKMAISTVAPATPVADALDALKTAGMKIEIAMNPASEALVVVHVPLAAIER